SEPVTEVKVDASTNLLEIGFDISGVAEDEVEKIIQAVMEKKHFYRLKSGAFMSLEDEAYTSIESLLTNLDLKTQDVTKKGIQIPAYRAAQLDELLETKKLYDDTFRRL